MLLIVSFILWLQFPGYKPLWFMSLLTLSTHVQEGYSSWVCLCVCLLSHISPLEHKNTVTYSASNGGQTIRGVFSETTLLQRFSTPPIESHMCRVSHFPVKAHMCIIVFRRRGFCTLVHSFHQTQYAY